MAPHTGPAVIALVRRHAATVAAAAVILSGVGLTGCAVAKAVGNVTQDVERNKATIDAFTATLKSGEATTFEARYVTTGSSPDTIVYAVRPPTGLAFTDTPTGGNGAPRLHIVVNSAGEYSCTPPGSGSGRKWSCQKLAAASAAARNKLLGIYSPAHWVAFLRDFAIAAGFAGDSVSTSDLTLNGFSMHCVDFRAPGVAGTSTICTTAQDILGYVKVASDPTSFQIRSYSPAPPASLFELPPGAKVTTRTAR
jgi:hypothetical protein